MVTVDHRLVLGLQHRRARRGQRRLLPGRAAERDGDVATGGLDRLDLRQDRRRPARGGIERVVLDRSNALPADAVVRTQHEGQGEVLDSRRLRDRDQVGILRHRHVDVGREHLAQAGVRVGNRGVHRDRTGLGRRARGIERRHRELVVGVGREVRRGEVRVGHGGDLLAVLEDLVAGDRAAARYAGRGPAQQRRRAGDGGRRQSGRRGRHHRGARRPDAVDMHRGQVQLAGSHEAETGFSVVGELAVPGGRSDHVAVAIVRDDLGVPDVGDQVRHIDRDLPGCRGGPVVVDRDAAVEAGAPGIGHRKLALQIARGIGRRRAVVVGDRAGADAIGQRGARRIGEHNGKALVGLDDGVADRRDLDALRRLAGREGERPRLGDIVAAGLGGAVGGGEVHRNRRGRRRRQRYREGGLPGRRRAALGEGRVGDRQRGNRRRRIVVHDGGRSSGPRQRGADGVAQHHGKMLVRFAEFVGSDRDGDRLGLLAHGEGDRAGPRGEIRAASLAGHGAEIDRHGFRRGLGQGQDEDGLVARRPRSAAAAEIEFDRGQIGHLGLVHRLPVVADDAAGVA